ncbi:tetratricopeptide repeat protein [Corynebacterium sp.]|uniref:tetratricopeptide repeat protein n=1 Tax=Corynebacterium sp. TaxID=1720 RepID=UPI0026DC12E3|nr:tetratricopeptide repeat protein [Corynebacterium sp.]MDO5076601.1 tetratricopeptide repeat protein [Corynebacterium sp.]
MTTPDRFVGGAIDLGEVKARAEARAQRPPEGGVPPVVTVTAANFEQEVVRRSLQVPVIVQLGSARSEQSEQLRADLATLASQAGLHWIFAYADVDTTPEIAQAFGVTGVPTVVALADGRPLADFQGGQPMEALQQWTAAVVSAVAGQLPGIANAEEQAPPADPRFDAATDALNAGDFAAAIAVYDDILAHEPANEQAKSARLQAIFLGRLAESGGAGDAVELADADLSDVDKQFAAADAEIAAGNVDAAFDRLIGALPRDKERVRARLIELFALFDASDPRVVAARGRMASVLF